MSGIDCKKVGILLKTNLAFCPEIVGEVISFHDFRAMLSQLATASRSFQDGQEGLEHM